MFFLLKFIKATRKGYFYKPETRTVWHPIYSENLSTEERRRQREAMLPDEWTWDIWDECVLFWGKQCAACGEKNDYLHRDHLVPLAHVDCPGAVPSNLIPLCSTCNTLKSATDFTIWYKNRFRRYPDKIIDKIHDWQYYCLKRGWN